MTKDEIPNLTQDHLKKKKFNVVTMMYILLLTFNQYGKCFVFPFVSIRFFSLIILNMVGSYKIGILNL